MNSQSKTSTTLLEFDNVLSTYQSPFHGLKALSPYVHWFPLQRSVALAGIIADLMGDGHLQDSPKLRLDYTSKHIIELQRFNQQLSFLFNIQGKVRDCTTNRYGTKNLGVNNKPLARTLKLLGVPTGRKVITPFFIPEWILTDKLYFARFVNRLFSCEATVDPASKAIEIQMYKSLEMVEDGITFFNQLKEGLENHFGIITSRPFLESRIFLRSDGTRTRAIRLKIKKKDSLQRFKEFISFDDKDKLHRLIAITTT
ncbi:MAG: hypothetical protein WC595_00800 [Candidatus Nanoarchaeia archaeon]